MIIIYIQKRAGRENDYHYHLYIRPGGLKFGGHQYNGHQYKSAWPEQKSHPHMGY